MNPHLSFQVKHHWDSPSARSSNWHHLNRKGSATPATTRARPLPHHRASNLEFAPLWRDGLESCSQTHILVINRSLKCSSLFTRAKQNHFIILLRSNYYIYLMPGVWHRGATTAQQINRWKNLILTENAPKRHSFCFYTSKVGSNHHDSHHYHGCLWHHQYSRKLSVTAQTLYCCPTWEPII